MRQDGLDWEEVRTFAAVVAARTARRAAAALGVHHTTVTRRVEALEARLGTRLLDRTPEGYVLTPAGEALAAAAGRVDAELTAAERRIAGQDLAVEGSVTLTVAEPLAVAAFAPRLPELAAAHPGLELTLDTAMDLRDVARREADVAVRMDNAPSEALVGKRLFPYRQTGYASPAYLAAHDLAGRPETARWLGWGGDERHPDWTGEAGLGRVPVWGAFPSPTMQQAAARAGLGLAMLPCLLGDADPGLVRAGAAEPTASRDIWILTHADLRRTMRVRVVMAFAERVLRDLRGAITG